MLQGANGTLGGRDLVSVVDLFDNPAIENRPRMVDNGEGGLVITKGKSPVWYRMPAPDSMNGASCSASPANCRKSCGLVSKPKGWSDIPVLAA
jgi:hypothetical protein